MDLQRQVVRLEERISLLERSNTAKTVDLTSHLTRISQLEAQVETLRRQLNGQHEVNQKLQKALEVSNAAAVTANIALRQFQEMTSSLMVTTEGLASDSADLLHALGAGRAEGPDSSSGS